MLAELDRRSGAAGELGLLATIREDRRHHWNEFTRPGFQALAVQRLGHWAYSHPDATFAPMMGVSCRLLTRYVRYRFGIELAPSARLGRRLSFGHQGGISIGADVTMGDDCAILQGTRIGRVEGESSDGPGPRIGHRVHVGARAIVRGDLDIGDDAKIGPNAVITTDVPSGATALARPSQVKRLPNGGGGVGSGAAPADG
jgi:serine acetyltransferase